MFLILSCSLAICLCFLSVRSVFLFLLDFCPFLGDTARAWGILPVPRGDSPCLGDFAHSWRILPVPGGYCLCLGEPARAWGILLHLMKGFTSSRRRVSIDPADRVPPTPATQWHHPASNHKW